MSCNDTPHQDHTLRFADLSQQQGTHFQISLNHKQTEVAITDLGLIGLRKTWLAGELSPTGAGSWTLSATLGATVIQPCTISLKPVTTRIDVPVLRQYVPDLAAPEDPEIEMPEDDTLEPMTASIDLSELLLEELALNLPQYPRAPGAELGAAVFTEPGKAAMTDEDARPFASLAEFRKALDTDKK